jgi:hypothetical protein
MKLQKRKRTCSRWRRSKHNVLVDEHGNTRAGALGVLTKMRSGTHERDIVTSWTCLIQAESRSQPQLSSGQDMVVY